MQSTLSRRVAITSLCAAVAVPVTAYATPSAADAELIALGKEMDRLWTIMADADCRAAPQEAAFRAGLSALNDSRKGRDDDHIPNSEYEAMFARVSAEFPVAFPTPDDVSNMMDAPSRRIMALPAMTIAGLAVKANLYRSNFSDLWDRPANTLDWDDQMARALVDSVLRIASVQP